MLNLVFLNSPYVSLKKRAVIRVKTPNKSILALLSTYFLRSIIVTIPKQNAPRKSYAGKDVSDSLFQDDRREVSKISIAAAVVIAAIFIKIVILTL